MTVPERDSVFVAVGVADLVLFVETDLIAVAVVVPLLVLDVVCDALGVDIIDPDEVIDAVTLSVCAEEADFSVVVVTIAVGVTIVERVGGCVGTAEFDGVTTDVADSVNCLVTADDGEGDSDVCEE